MDNDYRRYFTTLAFWLLALTLNAATPSFQSFDPAYFDTNGNIISLDGNITNQWRLDISNANTTNGVVSLVRTNGTSTNFFGTTDISRGTALLTAQTNAAFGDAIFVGPGQFTIHSDRLGKHGVNYSFSPGSVVSSGSTVWDDRNTEMDFSVGGLGKFITLTNIGPVISISNAASQIFMSALVVTNASTNQAPVTGNVTGVYVNGGALTIVVYESIGSRTYDALWLQSGFMSVSCPSIFGFNAGLDYSGGNFILECGSIGSSNTPITFSDSIGGNGTVRVKAQNVFTFDPANQSSSITGSTNTAYIMDILEANHSFFMDTARIRFVNTRLDSSLNELGAGAIVMDGGTLSLENVTLIAGDADTYSLNTSGTATVGISGSLRQNKPTNPAIITIGGYHVGDGGGLTNLLQRAGKTNIANLATSQAVLFSKPFPVSVSTNYAVTYGFEGSISATAALSTTAKTTNGFTANIVGITTGAAINYYAVPYQ